MLARTLADLVLALHLLFIVFVVLGALLWLRFAWAPYVHLPALAWGAFVELSGRVCPLTPLENALRRAGGETGYTGGFIDHYLVPVIYPPGLSARHQLALGLGVLLVNAAAYALCWRLRRRA